MLKRVHRWLKFHEDRQLKYASVLAVIIHAQRLGLLHLNMQTAVAFVGFLAVLAVKESIATSELEQLDSQIADMNEQEENEQRFQPPQRWYYIDDLETNEVAREHTRFTKEELHDIFQRFEIPTGTDGKIRICCEKTGTHRWYAFGPEEVFLYAMIKAAEGHTHVNMAKDVFGGTDGARRFGHACKWFCEYVVSM